MIERLILGHLLTNISYRKRVIKHLVPSHFGEHSNLIEVIQYIAKKYHMATISPSVLATEIDDLVVKRIISREHSVSLKTFAAELYSIDQVEEDWLFDKTEQFTKDKSIYSAILEAITIYEDPKRKITDIPAIMTKALKTSFSPNVGMEFNKDPGERWDKYNSPTVKVPFKIRSLNLATNGGPTKGTLNIINAIINKGKSMTMFALAADYMSLGYNVAIFSMEMSELAVMNRVDASLLRTPINFVSKKERGKFIKEIEDISTASNGRLKIKQYFTGEGNAALFRQDIEDWKAYDKFVPDVIFVDYLGICTSSIPGMMAAGSYANLKQISIELRALAQWSDTVLWTAMQLNREGIKSGGAGGMADMSESIGVPMTADLVLLLQRTSELDGMGKAVLHQIKTRFEDASLAPAITLKLNTACQYFEDDPDYLQAMEIRFANRKSEFKITEQQVDDELEKETLDFLNSDYFNSKTLANFNDDDIKV